MKDLLPLEAYERTDPVTWWRGALTVGVLWAVPCASIEILTGQSSLEPGRALILWTLMGLGFGTFFMATTGYSARSLARRVHRADPAIVPAPPEGRQEYRLACGYLPEGRKTAVGGHLYAGPGALTFVPHRKNPRRLRTPFTLPAGPDLAIEVVEVHLGGLQRLFLESPSRRLRIRGGGAPADFLTPDPDEVAEALRRYYRSTAALHPPGAAEIPHLQSAGREPQG